jgi:carboxylate-amine ligase
MRASFPQTLGVEEEYLLVDLKTRALVADPPLELFRACEARHPGHVSAEFLRCQIEVGTPVCHSVQEAAAHLKALRATLIEVSEGFGYAPIACSTHPFSHWEEQKTTEGERYQAIEDELQGVVRRLTTCGMHVHVGVPTPELAVTLMGQLKAFLPVLLALSTSSPFWRGRDTGLKSYRLTVFDSLPRTGLPLDLEDHSAYMRYIERLSSCGVLKDASKLWWDLRPSQRFPTLEMRVTDTCTRLEDTLAITALYFCLHAKFYRLQEEGLSWPSYPSHLIKENRWRAQRYGLERGMIDFGREAISDGPRLISWLLKLLKEEAEELGCVDELNHIEQILQRGTSADRQRRVFSELLNQGASREEAFKGLVDDLIQETRVGVCV